MPGLPQRGAVPPGSASRLYSTYTDGLAGKSGWRANPSSPRSQKLWTCVREVGEDGGGAVGQVVEDLDDPPLLGHEHPPVG